MRFIYRIAGEIHRTEIVPGLRIGRMPDNEIVFHDLLVSRRHATIVRILHDFYIEDNGSVNGVYINGERIDEATRLKPGMVVKIGGIKIEIIE